MIIILVCEPLWLGHVTDRTANCLLLGSGRGGLAGWMDGWMAERERAGCICDRVGGSDGRVSDERSASLTVVLGGHKHQSQVIYSLTMARTLPFFPSGYVCL